MRDFRQKKKHQEKHKKRYLSYFIFLLLLILIFFFSWQGYITWKSKKIFEEKHAYLNKEYDTLLRKIASLKEKEKKLRDDYGKKEEIKKLFSVGEKGEYIIYLQKGSSD